MTQPKFVPISIDDEVRELYKLEPPKPWRPHRPAELSHADLAGKGRGTPGPDQGYALRLAERLAERVVLGAGEHLDDVLSGAVAVALRRAALYGRAPVRTDIEVALSLFDFLLPAPKELVETRKALFSGCAHDDWVLRQVADSVPEDLLRLTPDEARGLALRAASTT